MKTLGKIVYSEKEDEYKIMWNKDTNNSHKINIKKKQNLFNKQHDL